MDRKTRHKVCKKCGKTHHPRTHPDTPREEEHNDNPTKKIKLEEENNAKKSESMEKSVFQVNKIYVERLQTGKEIEQILNEYTVYEESLNEEQRYALELYRKYNIYREDLFYWRQQALQLTRRLSGYV